MATQTRQHGRTRKAHQFSLAAAVLLLSGIAGLATVASAPAGAQPTSGTVAATQAPATSDVCGPAAADSARCLAVKLNDPSSWRGRHVGAENKGGPEAIFGYTPADLAAAYNLPTGAGGGQTVAVVDAYDDPNAQSDLAVYRSEFNLPPCGTGCFKKVDEFGGTNYPHANSGWGGEISLDLDMVSAVCPHCSIVLVEANSSSNGDLGTAVDTAVNAEGATEVSNSYGAPETQHDSALDPYYDHPGVAITVASGDNGYQTDYPASSPYVTAVGGTSLDPAPNTTRGWSETAWSDAASGCSSFEPRPSWQTNAIDPDCTMRTVADVSAVADPATGVALYDSFKAKGWLVYGGTSVSSPIIAAVYALAGDYATLHLQGAQRAYLSTSASDLYDVTSGSTAKCGTYLCTAGPGYDGPTGNGTPDGVGAF